MKNLIKYVLCVLPLLYINCTEDLHNENPFNTDTVETEWEFSKISPSNSNNPYDSIGLVHNEILTTILDSGMPLESLSQIDNEVSVLLNDYDGLFSETCSDSLTHQELSSFYLSPSVSLNTAFTEAGLSLNTRDEIEGLLGAILNRVNDPYESFHAWMVLYEEEIIQSNYSIEEKRIILTIASLSRYSIFAKKRRDHKDWDYSVGNRIGATIGALDCSSNAIYAALVSGLSDEHL